MLHLDHHTLDDWNVGWEADYNETERLLRIANPDVIQIHTKGNPGWTTYPSKVGFTPPKLKVDVIDVWSRIARNNGFIFSAYYNIGRDGEIMKRKPEWNRIDVNGQPYHRKLCYNSGVVEGYLWPQLEEIMIKYHPAGFWFDGSCFTVDVCYCDRCNERFRGKYGVELPKAPDENLWDEFKDMNRQIYKEFIDYITGKIKEKDPQCLVCFNLAFGVRMPIEPEFVDYLSTDYCNNVWHTSSEQHWLDSTGKPFELVTACWLDYPDGSRRPKPVKQIQQEMAQAIANGGRYWAWDNPTNESGLVEERMQYLGDVVQPFLRSRKEFSLHSRRLPDMSFLFSATDHYMSTRHLVNCHIFPGDIDEQTAKLQKMHLNYEFVSETQLDKLQVNSPLLVVENATALSESNIKALGKLVKEGRNVLLTANTCMLNGVSKLCGVSVENTKEESVLWKIDVNGKEIAVKSSVWKTTLECAKLLISAKAEGTHFPMLTVNTVGRGCVYSVFYPLLTDEGHDFSLTQYIFDSILPLKNRLVSTDLPQYAEVILRAKENHRYVHIVNNHEGTRRIISCDHFSVNGSPIEPNVRIDDLPVIPAGTIWVKTEAKPERVLLEPEGVELQWTFDDGYIKIHVTKVEVHAIVDIVMEE